VTIHCCVIALFKCFVYLSQATTIIFPHINASTTDTNTFKARGKIWHSKTRFSRSPEFLNVITCRSCTLMFMEVGKCGTYDQNFIYATEDTIFCPRKTLDLWDTMQCELLCRCNVLRSLLPSSSETSKKNAVFLL
jgi:hypothetical protein